MHDLARILSDKEHRRELRREAEMDRLAAEARESRNGQPAGRTPEPDRDNDKTRRSSARERYSREAPDKERNPS